MTINAKLYVPDGHAGLGLRFLLALKRAPIDAYVVAEVPPVARALGVPKHALPVMIDRNVLLWGPALHAFISERFPSPSLLPSEPLTRAQYRILAQTIEHWDSTKADGVNELRTVYDPESNYILGDQLSLVDVYATAFLRHAALSGMFLELAHDPMTVYYRRMSALREFKHALHCQQDHGRQAA